MHGESIGGGEVGYGMGEYGDDFTAYAVAWQKADPEGSGGHWVEIFPRPSL